MRIDDVNRSPLPQATEKTNLGSATRSQSDKAGISNGDNADISPLAKALQTADPQRLEKLRLDVQGGQYRVSGDSVAKAIINDAFSE